MVTFVVKKKSVFFSQAAFQLFKFIQILFIYLPFSPLRGESSRPGRGVASCPWHSCPSGAHGWFNVEEEEGMDLSQEAAPWHWGMTVSCSTSI